MCIRDRIEALESGKVGAAGLDVIEDELGMYYYNRKSDGDTTFISEKYSFTDK